MVNEVKYIISIIICLISNAVCATHESDEHFLSFEAVTINSKRTKTINFTAFGDNFIAELTIFYPLYFETKIETVSKEEKETSDQVGESHALYHGEVEDYKNSLVLGYFLKSGGFQGYVLTDDQVYCIDSLHRQNEATIIYKFKDTIPPGCLIVKQGKEIDCLQARDFQPWFSEIASQDDWQENEMPLNNQNFRENLSTATEILGPPETVTAEVFSRISELDASKIYSENKNSFLSKRDIVHLKGLHEGNDEEAMLKEPTTSSSDSKFSSSNRFNDISCSLKIVASPSFMKYFNESTNDVVKDIFLQTEMLNILYRKITFRNKTKTFKINFHIDSITLPNKDLWKGMGKHFSLEEFVKKHGHAQSSVHPACLTVGLDMNSLDSNTFFGHSTEKAEVCIDGKNTIIVLRGTLEKPEPMALFFASYARAITAAFGASNGDEVCQTGSPPNPLILIEKYFLSKIINPKFSYGLFSACNVQEVEKSLSTKKCFCPFKYSTCGNAIRESGEECDCGPKALCENLDKCCMPPISMFVNETDEDENDKQCVLRYKAQCTSEELCCDECQFAEKGTQCLNGTDNCGNGICYGNSSNCHCLSSASLEQSMCMGLECGVIPCAMYGLKPCLCEGKDECLICCYHHDICKTAIRELKLSYGKLLAFPNGTECSEKGTCKNGTCVRDRTPKTRRAEGEPKSNRSSRNSISFGLIIITLLIPVLNFKYLTFLKQ